MQLKNLFKELLEYQDDYWDSEHCDKWGATITLAFDLNAHAYNNGYKTDKTYRPSPVAFEQEISNCYVLDNNLNNAEIQKLIRFCSKLLYCLEKAELDY